VVGGAVLITEGD
jgi:cathepsin H